MIGSQRSITDKALFDYYLVSSSREEEIISQSPYWMDRSIFERMVEATRVLDALVRRIIATMLDKRSFPGFSFDSFPALDQILGLGISLPPFFWARYDAFQRRDGGVFFSEFNYDKPCAQREIAITPMLEARCNPNTGFADKFRRSFRQLCEQYHSGKEDLRVAILVDPSHYEEVHLAQLYMDMLQPLGYEFIITGGRNFTVDGDSVRAFDRPIDVILRQFPTEFLHEVDGMDQILQLYNQGKVLLINDPRCILGQTKSLFSCLWYLVETEDSFLTEKEREVIRAAVPHTVNYHPGMKDPLLRSKDAHVIKAAYGRYSEEVYIGAMCTQEEWEEVITYVTDSEKLHIVQEFCPIRKENVLRFSEGAYREEQAFGNFGIHLTNGEFSGICVRWSTDYLSMDETVWSSAVVLRERSLRVKKPEMEMVSRLRLWEEINAEAAFQWGYTDNYTGDEESFLLERILLPRDQYEELKQAAEQMADIIKKTTRLVQDNAGLFCPILGISDSLSGLVVQSYTDMLSLIGRFDWVYDASGDLKLLEFNAETPGGLLESIILSRLIKQRLNLNDPDPNEQLGSLLAGTFEKIVKDYGKFKEVRNIGLVSSSYHEDWYNTTILMEQIKDLPYHFILGEVSGLEARDGRLYLYGTPLDAVYRYYPLDWFDSDPYYQGVVEALGDGTLSINPPSTLISQSKAFFALLWELLDGGYYTPEEAEWIRRYIPRTALSPKKLKTDDFCIKPFFGREGQQVVYHRFEPGFRPAENDCVFQERVEIQPVELDIHTTLGVKKEIRYPVIGTYVAGDRFAGIFTRAGSRVTGKRIVYLPVYIQA